MKLLILFLLVFGGCATINMNPVIRQSEKQLNQVLKICREHIKNKPLARQKCFPLLKDKEIFTVVREIDESPMVGIIIHGETGSRNRVWCEPTQELAKAIQEDPTLIKIGEIYKVQGEFERLSLGYSLNFFTIKNCKATLWN